MSGEPFDIDAVEARAAAATPGPWERAESDANVILGPERHGMPRWVTNLVDLIHEEDAEFIAHAREDVPALVAEVKRLRVKLAAVESLIPNTDEEFPIFPYQLRAAIGARVEDYVLVPAAGLRVGRSAEAECDAALAAVERVRALCDEDWHRAMPGYLLVAEVRRALDPGAEQR